MLSEFPPEFIEAKLEQVRRHVELEMLKPFPEPWTSLVHYAVPSWWPPTIGKVDPNYRHYGIIVAYA